VHHLLLTCHIQYKSKSEYSSVWQSVCYFIFLKLFCAIYMNIKLQGSKHPFHGSRAYLIWSNSICIKQGHMFGVGYVHKGTGRCVQLGHGHCGTEPPVGLSDTAPSWYAKGTHSYYPLIAVTNALRQKLNFGKIHSLLN
jgi:hypothetical protein